MNIRITTLGTLRIAQADRLLTALPAQRMRCAMLVYLAVVRETTRERLVGLFWPERTEERARHALSQTLYELRRALGDDFISIRGDALKIAAGVTIDVVAFEQAVEDGNYEAGLSFYRGPFMDGFFLPAASGFADWMDNQRARAQRQHRRARRERIRHLVDSARIRDALITAREWVAIDPGDDEGQHRLIELLAETGDRAGAIRQYESYERMLQHDDLVPLDETRELIAAVRAGAVGELPGSAATGPIDDLPSIRAAFPPTPAPEPGPAAEQPATATHDAAAGKTPARRSSLIAAALVLLAAVGVIVTWQVTASSGRAAGEASDAGDATSPSHQIAVLYLDDVSPPPGAPHLAAAVTETLIQEFSNLEPQLSVRSSHAVSRFRERAVDPDSIGRALNVGMLVTGDVAAVDGVVRVRIRLVDAATGTVAAARTIESREGEYFAMLDDVVENVATLLRQEIGVRIRTERQRRGTTSQTAWLHVQQAAELRRTMPHAAATSIDAGRRIHARADSMLETAEAIDPAWLEPLIERGRLAERRAQFELALGYPELSRQAIVTAIQHADRALAREPRNAAALELRGTAIYRRAGFLESVDASGPSLQLATRDLAAAAEADPTRAQALSMLAVVYFRQGRFAEAGLAARDAQRADAFLRSDADNQYYAALAEFEMGHDAEAARMCDRGLQRHRNAHFAYCALTVMAWSDTEPPLPDSAWAIANVVPYTSVNGHPTTRPMLDALVAAVLQRAGLADSASAVLDRTSAMPQTSDAAAWIEAVVRHRFGETQRAVAIMEKTFPRQSFPESMRRMRALQDLLRHPAMALPDR